MQITSGFIFLFLALILPGIIFRRFYFQGEFSKQVSSKEPIIRSIVYAVIPSIIIQFLGIYLCNFFNIDIKLAAIIDFQKNLLSESTYFNNATGRNELNNIFFGNFIYYSFSIYLLSLLLGVFSFIIVRSFSLDVKFKLLRFKNQWAYVFSGEVLKFNKFDINKDLISDKQEVRYLFPYLDVLVRKTEQETTLYSGYLIDYELDPDKINELDRLFISKASRYNKTKKGYDIKRIPGEFIVLMGKDIININVQYVFQRRKKEKTQRRQTLLLHIYNISLILLLYGSIPFFIVRLESIQNEIYKAFYNLHWVEKIGIWYVLNILYNLAFPFNWKIDGDVKYKLVSRKEFKWRLLYFLVVATVILAMIMIL